MTWRWQVVAFLLAMVVLAVASWNVVIGAALGVALAIGTLQLAVRLTRK